MACGWPTGRGSRSTTRGSPCERHRPAVCVGPAGVWLDDGGDRLGEAVAEGFLGGPGARSGGPPPVGRKLGGSASLGVAEARLRDELEQPRTQVVRVLPPLQVGDGGCTVVRADLDQPDRARRDLGARGGCLDDTRSEWSMFGAGLAAGPGLGGASGHERRGDEASAADDVEGAHPPRHEGVSLDAWRVVRPEDAVVGHGPWVEGRGILGCPTGTVPVRPAPRFIPLYLGHLWSCVRTISRSRPACLARSSPRLI